MRLVNEQNLKWIHKVREHRSLKEKIKHTTKPRDSIVPMATNAEMIRSGFVFLYTKVSVRKCKHKINLKLTVQNDPSSE